jgi:hypothetical protein
VKRFNPVYDDNTYYGGKDPYVTVESLGAWIIKVVERDRLHKASLL